MSICQGFWTSLQEIETKSRLKWSKTVPLSCFASVKHSLAIRHSSLRSPHLLLLKHCLLCSQYSYSFTDPMLEINMRDLYFSSKFFMDLSPSDFFLHLPWPCFSVPSLACGTCESHTRVSVGKYRSLYAKGFHLKTPVILSPGDIEGWVIH